MKQTFFEILYTDKVIDVLKSRLAALRGHLASIRQRYEKGLESDYARHAARTSRSQTSSRTSSTRSGGASSS